MPIITFISEIAGKVAISIISKYIVEKGEVFFGSNKTDFTKELENVIYDTIEEFDKVNHIPDEGQKFPFYKSEILIQALLSIKFLGRETIDESELKNALAENRNIITPKLSEINRFLYLFEEKCKSNQNLRKHQFNDNYKEAIFKVLEVVDSINSVLNKVISEIKSSLKAEYFAQLDEIQENIHAFKPKTALARLEGIEKRIAQNNLLSPEVESKLLYLKGVCIIDSNKDRSGAEYIVRAYIKNSSPLLKAEAALAYYNVGDNDKAKQLADEILKDDPFNVIAWMLLVLMAGKDFKDALKAVPPIVRSKRGFAASIIRHLRFSLKLTFAEIEQTGLTLPKEIDDKITYINKIFWEIVSEILLSEFFESGDQGFDNEGRVNYQDKEGLDKLIIIQDRLFQAIRGTEIQDNYSELKFYHYFIRHLQGDDSFDKNEFKSLHAKLKDSVFYIDVHYAEFLGDTKDFKGAISVLEQSKFQSHEFVSLLRIYYNLVIGEKAEALQLFQKHIEGLDTLDFQSIYNLTNSFKLFISEKQSLKEQYERTLETKPFVSNEIKEIFKILIQINFFNDQIDLTETSKKLLELGKHFKSEPKIVLYISEILYSLKLFSNCIELLEPLTQKGIQTKINIVYAYALFNSKTKLTHLLQFLQEIRANNENNVIDLLFIEYNLRRDISDWNSILDISKRGIALYPEVENFHLNLLSALERKEDVAQIKEYVEKYYKNNFKNEQIGIYVSVILMRSGFLKEAAVLLYNLASNPSNHLAKVNYVTFMNFPEGFMIDYDQVEKGSYIKLADRGGRNIKLIETRHGDKYNLTGKKLGESVMIQDKTGVGLNEFFVARVMNNHLFLLEQILNESKDPNSELPLHGYNFSTDEGEFDIAGLNKYFTEKFGAEEKLRREHIDKIVNSYNNGGESFGDMCRQLFNDNLLDCYQHLSYNGFYVVPSFHNAGLILSSNETYAIDFTTLILLTELKNKHGIIIARKFIISPSLTTLLKNELIRIQAFPSKRMNLAIMDEGVRPIVYPENYHEEQVKTLNSLLDFIKDNCIEKIIEEKVDLITEKVESVYDSAFMQYQVDNAMFCSNLGYTLVSNDSFLQKYFKQIAFKQISPENFLMRFLGKSYPKEIENYFIDHNYIGVNISSEILLKEYKESKLGKPNHFNTCIMNLKFRISLSPNNMVAGIKFLKEIYVSDLGLDNEKYLLAQSIFTNLLDGCSHNGKMIQIIRTGIYSEFNLLGTAFDAVSDAFETTLKMYQRRI